MSEYGEMLKRQSRDDSDELLESKYRLRAGISKGDALWMESKRRIRRDAEFAKRIKGVQGVDRLDAYG